MATEPAEFERQFEQLARKPTGLHLCSGTGPSLPAPSLHASGGSMDIFIYSICRYAVCIILNLERTLHPLTGVFPAGKKKKKERNQLYIFYILE